jgi:drug/metabolite transporter (DMT)-like permease
MLLAALLLLPFALRAGLRSLPPGRIARIGLLQIGLPYALMFAAQQWIPSSLAAVLFATFPVWLVLAARLLMHDQPLTIRKLLAAALGIAGVVVLQGPALFGNAYTREAALGGLLVVTASIVAAVANVLVRRDLHAVPPIATTFGQVFTGALFLLGLALALERHRPVTPTAASIAAVLYLAVFGTAITYLTLFWLLPRVSIAAIGAIPLLDTTVAVILGALVLGEGVGWQLVAGGALVLTGAVLANQTPAEPAPAAT